MEQALLEATNKSGSHGERPCPPVTWRRPVTLLLLLFFPFPESHTDPYFLQKQNKKKNKKRKPSVGRDFRNNQEGGQGRGGIRIDRPQSRALFVPHPTRASLLRLRSCPIRPRLPVLAAYSSRRYASPARRPTNRQPGPSVHRTGTLAPQRAQFGLPATGGCADHLAPARFGRDAPGRLFCAYRSAVRFLHHWRGT